MEATDDEAADVIVREATPVVNAESIPDEAPKSKKAKNKASPSTSSRYAHLMITIDVEAEDDDEPEEQING